MAREGLAAQRVYVRVPDNKRPCLIDQYRIYTSGASSGAVMMAMGAVMGARCLRHCLCLLLCCLVFSRFFRGRSAVFVVCCVCRCAWTPVFALRFESSAPRPKRSQRAQKSTKKKSTFPGTFKNKKHKRVRVRVPLLRPCFEFLLVLLV